MAQAGLCALHPLQSCWDLVLGHMPFLMMAYAEEGITSCKMYGGRCQVFPVTKTPTCRAMMSAPLARMVCAMKCSLSRRSPTRVASLGLPLPCLSSMWTSPIILRLNDASLTLCHALLACGGPSASPVVKLGPMGAGISINAHFEQKCLAAGAIPLIFAIHIASYAIHASTARGSASYLRRR